MKLENTTTKTRRRSPKYPMQILSLLISKPIKSRLPLQPLPLPCLLNDLECQFCPWTLSWILHNFVSIKHLLKNIFYFYVGATKYHKRRPISVRNGQFSKSVFNIIETKNRRRVSHPWLILKIMTIEGWIKGSKDKIMKLDSGQVVGSMGERQADSRRWYSCEVKAAPFKDLEVCKIGEGVIISVFSLCLSFYFLAYENWKTSLFGYPVTFEKLIETYSLHGREGR